METHTRKILHIFENNFICNCFLLNTLKIQMILKKKIKMFNLLYIGCHSSVLLSVWVSAKTGLEFNSLCDCVTMSSLEFAIFLPQPPESAFRS